MSQFSFIILTCLVFVFTYVNGFHDGCNVVATLIASRAMKPHPALAWAAVVEFLSGAVVPLSFFPEALQPFVYALPFASMQNAPFEIYIGRIDPSQALGVLALQAAWLAALTALGRKLMKRSLRRVVIQGG